jgi:hypothetical protein
VAVSFIGGETTDLSQVIDKLYHIMLHQVPYQNFIFTPVFGAAVVMIAWKLDLQLPVQSVPITTNVVCSNPTRGEVYSIQHYDIKFISDLQHVGGFHHQ